MFNDHDHLASTSQCPPVERPSPIKEEAFAITQTPNLKSDFILHKNSFNIPALTLRATFLLLQKQKKNPTVNNTKRQQKVKKEDNSGRDWLTHIGKATISSGIKL